MPEDEKTVNSLSLFSLCATITDAANAASGILLVNNVGMDKNKSPDTKFTEWPCCTISSNSFKVVWRSINPRNTSVKKAKDRKQSFIMYRSIRSMVRMPNYPIIQFRIGWIEINVKYHFALLISLQIVFKKSRFYLAIWVFIIPFCRAVLAL